jgi:hypothetical protein
MPCSTTNPSAHALGFVGYAGACCRGLFSFSVCGFIGGRLETVAVVDFVAGAVGDDGVEGGLPFGDDGVVGVFMEGDVGPTE